MLHYNTYDDPPSPPWPCSSARAGRRLAAEALGLAAAGACRRADCADVGGDVGGPALMDACTRAEVRFRDVTLGYDRHPAVHHLSGTVEQGALLAVVGPNGAG